MFRAFPKILCVRYFAKRYNWRNLRLTRNPTSVTDAHPTLDWNQDVPVATRFDDPYYSLEDGLAETRYVFLDGNDLRNRYSPGFRIAELGFGTGLNCAAALALWREIGVEGPLSFTSFEAYPLDPETMCRALAPFRDVSAAARDVVSAVRRKPPADLDLTIVVGDANQTLQPWDGAADAWFLDGFSPEKNPELWNDTLMAEVAAHTVPGGTFATYTAAGAVRRGLAAAGFDVTRAKGFARKRHMTLGRMP